MLAIAGITLQFIENISLLCIVKQCCLSFFLYPTQNSNIQVTLHVNEMEIIPEWGSLLEDSSQ